jgi:hypothetical protein
VTALPTLPEGQGVPEWDGFGPEPNEPPPDPLEAWDAPPSGQVAARPVIRIAPGELSRMIRECIGALARDPNLYQRGGELVRIVREPERLEPLEADPHDPHAHVDIRRGSDILLRPGTPRLAPAAPVLLERADLAARWERWDAKRGERKKEEGRGGKASGEWVVADPHGTVVKQIAVRRDYPGVRPVRGILETPCLAPSSRIILAPGYDEETGHVLLPSCDVGTILERPSREHARNALRYLWTELACDFPFRGVGEPNPEDTERKAQWGRALEVPDAFVGVAMLLTIFARLAILGAVPSGLFEAAGQGSGKSLQIHTISLVATGRPAGVATFPIRDGKADEAELEKVLMGYALASARIVAFDNIRGMLAGGTLERAQTAVDHIEGRVLGSNDQRSLPWYAVLMFSGNNMNTSDDVAQRTLVSRLESRREDPRSRPANTFMHPDLLEAIRGQRARLVRAVLVILRSYLAARAGGESVPDAGSRGSFEAWSRIVPGALMWAGGPNIMGAFPEAGRGGDEEGEAHATLLRMWRDDWQGQRSSIIADALFADEREILAGKAPPDGMGDARAAVRALCRVKDGHAPSAHQLGVKLRGLRGKPRGDKFLEVGKDPSGNVAVYWVRDVG